jgi:hypothetical protein
VGETHTGKFAGILRFQWGKPPPKIGKNPHWFWEKPPLEIMGVLVGVTSGGNPHWKLWLRGLRYLEHGALRARKTRKSRKVC